MRADPTIPVAGFGMREPGAAEEARRRAAARSVSRLLRFERLPEPDEETLEAFSTTKGLFNRVLRQDQPDWFVAQVRLGYASEDRCGRIAVALAQCRKAIKAGDAHAWAGARLETRALRTRRSLMAYRGRRRLDEVPGSGFVYVMSCREEPDRLLIGATALPILEEAALVNADRVEVPLGVRALWWVTDVAAASVVVTARMGSVVRATEAGLHEVDLRRAKQVLDHALAIEGIVMDPFASLVRVAGNASRHGLTA